MLSPCARLVRIMSPTVLPRRYARRPRRTLSSNDCQRTSRKLSVHAVILCASCPHYTAQALRARGKRAVALPHAFGLPAIVAGWAWCATRTASAAAESTATTTMHSPTHRRLRQALRTLCSHDRQRTSRKLSVHAVALCALCPLLYCPGGTRPRQARSQSSYLALSGCQLLS